MDILLGSHRYLPSPGGSERIVQLLAEGLTRRGHSATVITQFEEGTPARETLHGVQVVRLPMWRGLPLRVPHAYLRTLRSLSADVFHLHGNNVWVVDWYLPFARIFGWPQVLTGHGFYGHTIRQSRYDVWYFQRYLPRAAAGFDLYVALTDRERDQIVGWGFPGDRTRVVPNGIALEEFAVRRSDVDAVRASWGLRAEHALVYAGGFFENKRVDRLVEAVAATHGRWGLVIIGQDVPRSPYNAAYCEALARKLGAEVRIQGVRPREEVVASLQAADAVGLASDFEGFGILLLEAMAAGRPFVAYPSGAVESLAATGGGLVVRSAEEMTAALTELETAEVREKMGTRARQAIPNWSDDRMTERYLEIYREVLERRNPRSP